MVSYAVLSASVIVVCIYEFCMRFCGYVRVRVVLFLILVAEGVGTMSEEELKEHIIVEEALKEKERMVVMFYVILSFVCPCLFLFYKF